MDDKKVIEILEKSKNCAYWVTNNVLLFEGDATHSEF